MDQEQENPTDGQCKMCRSEGLQIYRALCLRPYRTSANAKMVAIVCVFVDGR